MKKNNHLLADLWERYPSAFAEKSVDETIPIGQYISDLVTLGPYYHYIIDIVNYSIKQVSTSLLSIHGLEEYPNTLQDIIDLIHPDDLDFVINAEKVTMDNISKLGLENILLVKTAYRFRMKVADGSYHLFHHQVIHLRQDDQLRLTAALNIHTDIQHICTKNNNIIRIESPNGIRYIDFSDDRKKNTLNLTKREVEILNLLAEGLTSQEIANKLYTSVHTIKVHRKNMLRKTNTSSTRELIGRCMGVELFSSI